MNSQTKTKMFLVTGATFLYLNFLGGSSNKNIARIANAVQVTICLVVSTSVY